LWWSDFTRLSATRFNVWYLLFALVSVGLYLGWSRSTEATEASIVNTPVVIEHVPPVVNQGDAIEPRGAAEIVVTDRERGSAPSRTERTTTPEITLTDEQQTASQTAQLEHPSDASLTEETQKENAPNESPAHATPGSKKGLKVKTYDTSKKKR